MRGERRRLRDMSHWIRLAVVAALALAISGLLWWFGHSTASPLRNAKPGANEHGAAGDPPGGERAHPPTRVDLAATGDAPTREAAALSSESSAGSATAA